MKFIFAITLLFLGTFTPSWVRANSSKPPRPNIVILVADDLGYADVGFTGGKEIKTPNLDKIASSGAKLEQFYVQPVCTPTRAALLTGRYPIRYGLQSKVLRPWEMRGLPTSERLLPQALKEAGYTTAIIGKWHLGHNAPEYLPTKRGFDHQYGHYCGQIDYYEHDRQGGFDWHRNDKECRDEGYSTHLIAKEAVEFVGRQSTDRPFLLYVPFNAVHSPWQVPEEYRKPYRHLAEPRQTYAGMLAAMDEAIGKIYAALDEKGLLQKTLILFFSDNGGPSPGRVTDNGAFRGGKGGLYEGGIRVCAFAAWKGQIKAGSSITDPIHVVDWYPTLLKLAGASLKQELPFDGTNVWSVVTGNHPAPDRAILLNSTPEAGAIRSGNWKVVLKTGSSSEEESSDSSQRKKQNATEASPSIELFDLAKDPSERRNLASDMPQVVKELRKQYNRYASEAVEPRNEPEPPSFKAPRVWGERDH